MALIGAIIGDIIGSQYEFPSIRPDDLDWEHCELFSDKCEFTDDTVMSIATKYAFDHNYNFAEVYKLFGKRYPDVGYGDMFFKWLNNEIGSYQSYGNGAAMRISYIGDKISGQNEICDFVLNAIKDTHNTPSAIRGATTVASVISMANNHYTKADIFNFVKHIYKGCLYTGEETMETLRQTYYWNETSDGTVPVAIRCFLESINYESCIRNCLSLPCDMDTMCCIAGGIAESYYGTTGFDNKAILKKYLDIYLFNCIEDIFDGGQNE